MKMQQRCDEVVRSYGGSWQAFSDNRTLRSHQEGIPDRLYFIPALALAFFWDSKDVDDRLREKQIGFIRLCLRNKLFAWYGDDESLRLFIDHVRRMDTNKRLGYMWKMQKLLDQRFPPDVGVGG